MTTRRPSRVSDEELLAAAADAKHMRDLLTRLRISVDGGNYESVRWRLHRLGALDARFDRRRRRSGGSSRREAHDYTDEALAAAVTNARTKADVLRALGLTADTSQYRELNRRLAAAGVDVSGLAGRGWSGGARRPYREPLEAVLGRPRVHPAPLKRRLIAEGLLEPRCALCGITHWRGVPVTLELDHVNGDRSDNRLQNLRLLCPNCHAQTPTWRGRNIGRGMAGLEPPGAAADGVRD